jgi:hypothetical protein
MSRKNQDQYVKQEQYLNEQHLNQKKVMFNLISLLEFRHLNQKKVMRNKSINLTNF